MSEPVTTTVGIVVGLICLFLGFGLAVVRKDVNEDRLILRWTVGANRTNAAAIRRLQDHLGLPPMPVPADPPRQPGWWDRVREHTVRAKAPDPAPDPADDTPTAPFERPRPTPGPRTVPREIAVDTFPPTLADIPRGPADDPAWRRHYGLEIQNHHDHGETTDAR